MINGDLLQADREAVTMSSQRDMESRATWRALRQMFHAAFDLAELRTLCYDLGVDYEDLGDAGVGKQERVTRLLEHLHRRRRTDRLLALLRQERPQLPWPQVLPSASQSASPFGVPHRFQALIDDKTADFVGRDYVFEAIADFLSSWPSGYIELEGDPGAGKSAILAEYVQRNDIIAHFNLRPQGVNTARHFLESISQQLIDRYDLPYATLPADAMQDGSFLAKLLDEAAAQLAQGEKLVIGVDALDEVDLTSQRSGTNILYLPDTLPRQVYFILTRRQVSLPFTTHAERKIVDLMAFRDESQRDIQAYIRRAVNERPALQAWLNNRPKPLAINEFVLTLAAHSENNFMYLRYVLPDIERGLYDDLRLEALPVGLQDYYQDHWRRMGMTTRPLPETKLKIIYILCELKKPASRQLVSEFAGERALTVQSVLDEWMQFLHATRVDGQSRYTVYHSSFRDFLHRQEVVQAAGIDIPAIHGQIADNLWEELFEDGDLS
jgi:hypothetical protein